MASSPLRCLRLRGQLLPCSRHLLPAACPSCSVGPALPPLSSLLAPSSPPLPSRPSQGPAPASAASGCHPASSPAGLEPRLDALPRSSQHPRHNLLIPLLPLLCASAVPAEGFCISNNVSPKRQQASLWLCTDFTGIFRSPFIRLKTNNAARQPTRTRAPVNSFLCFLGRGRSCVLRASTHRWLLPPAPPVTPAAPFPPHQVPAAPAEVGAWGALGSGYSPSLVAHHLVPKLAPRRPSSRQGFLHPTAPGAPVVFPRATAPHIPAPLLGESNSTLGQEGFFWGSAFWFGASLAIFSTTLFLNRSFSQQAWLQGL